MGMMRLLMDRKSRFVCKFCNQKFSCGKSLGGHLRSHSITQLRNEAVKISPSSSPSLAYVSKTQCFGGERLCKECGKGFRSMKALCGHMACHSDKVTKFETDDDEFSGFDRKQESETEESKRMTRYKHNLDFFNKSSSSVSDIEREQDQEVARCLMMLSRDIGSFPDNNSVFLDPKSNHSPIQHMKIEHNIDVAEDNCRIHGLNYKVKSQVSVDGFGLKRPKWVTHKSTFDADLGKTGSAQIKIGSSVRGFDGAKDRASVARKLGQFSHDKSFNSTRGLEADSFTVPVPRKANKFLISKAKKRIKGHECPICFRVFRSGQALGGHKRSHFIRGSDVARQQEVSGLFDLNLPAPEDTMAEWV